MTLKEEILKYSRQVTIAPLSPIFDTMLDDLIADNIYPKQADLEFAGGMIVNALRDYSIKNGVDTAVIGMSGGVDSALTAALFKAADWRVIGVTMPIHQRAEETDRGIQTSLELGLEHQHIDLTETYEDLLDRVRAYDKDIDDAAHATRRGNLRVRLRMLTLYNIASSVRGLVGGTDNFSELAAGFWTLHGDVGDLAPIQGLCKSWEVPVLAEMYGVPASTVMATPTDGLGFSDSDESQFGFSYLEFDIVMLRFTNLLSQYPELTIDELIESVMPEASDEDDRIRVAQILTRIKNSAFKRKNPFNISNPLYPSRSAGLDILDRALKND